MLCDGERSSAVGVVVWGRCGSSVEQISGNKINNIGCVDWCKEGGCGRAESLQGTQEGRGGEAASGRIMHWE